MKLTVIYWKDLALLLDEIPPKDHKDTAEARKCIGSVEQIRAGIAKPIAKFDALQREFEAAAKPYGDKLKDIDQSTEEGKAAKDKLLEEANEAIKPINEKLGKLNEEFKSDEVEIKLDENYKAYIKSIWETKLRPKFKANKDLLAVADSLGV